jgi:hypothetical protein
MPDKPDWRIEWLRFVTPALVAVCAYQVTTMNSHIGKLDEKVDKTRSELSQAIITGDSNLATQINNAHQEVYKHLTNDEVHTPRSTAVTKAEFEMHCRFADRMVNQVEDLLKDFKKDVKDEINKTRR